MSNFMGAALTVDDIYPVGSIYMSVNAVEPTKLFGGTWERIKEKFLLGAGDTHTAGSTGGEFEHTLTVNEVPEHNHTIYGVIGKSEGQTGNIQYAPNNNLFVPIEGDTSSSGGGKPHNNTPPYLAVYIWKRTA